MSCDIPEDVSGYSGKEGNADKENKTHAEENKEG